MNRVGFLVMDTSNSQLQYSSPVHQHTSLLWSFRWAQCFFKNDMQMNPHLFFACLTAIVAPLPACCCCWVCPPQLLTLIAVLHCPAAPSGGGFLPSAHQPCPRTDCRAWTAATEPRSLAAATSSASSAAPSAAAADRAGASITLFPSAWFERTAHAPFPHLAALVLTLYWLANTLWVCMLYVSIVVKTVLVSQT